MTVDGTVFLNVDIAAVDVRAAHGAHFNAALDNTPLRDWRGNGHLAEFVGANNNSPLHRNSPPPLIVSLPKVRLWRVAGSSCARGRSAPGGSKDAPYSATAGDHL